MIEPFDAMFADLEKALRREDDRRKGPERYLCALELIRESIENLRVLGGGFIRDRETEIQFFRHVWPSFYGHLLLYVRLYDMESSRLTTSPDDWLAKIGKEEVSVANFFQANEDFWRYYHSGAACIDEQFTRAYSRARIFEPLSQVIDQEGATLASYQAAECIAMWEYGAWLREERACLNAGGGAVLKLAYGWGRSRADLTELLHALKSVDALLYEGQPADMSRYQKFAKAIFGVDIGNIYDRGRHLRDRKKDNVAFLRKMTNGLERKWDEADGKFE